MFAELRGSLRRHLGHAMHLHRAADRRGQPVAGTFERNDDVVRAQLRVADDVAWPLHVTKGEVRLLEDLAPMRHRLGGKRCIQDAGQLRCVGRRLGRIAEAWIGQQIRAADRVRQRGHLVRRDQQHEPMVIGALVDIHRRVWRVLAVVQPKELRPAQRALDRDPGRPDALRQQRCRHV